MAVTEKTRQDDPIHAIGAHDSELRLPAWVLAKIALRAPGYTGQLTVNFFAGGVTNIEWRQIEKQMK